MLKLKSGKEVNDSVGLLITILVRYPEIAKINYEPDNQLIKMSFLIKNDVQEETLKRFISGLKESIITFNYIEQVTNIIVDASFTINDDYINIELFRDIDTLTVNEINLITQLLHLSFSDNIIADNNEVFFEDELQWQEELITDMLENLKDSLPAKKLLAYRDEGKVRVFDK